MYNSIQCKGEGLLSSVGFGLERHSRGCSRGVLTASKAVSPGLWEDYS